MSNVTAIYSRPIQNPDGSRDKAQLAHGVEFLSDNKKRLNKENRRPEGLALRNERRAPRSLQPVQTVAPGIQDRINNLNHAHAKDAGVTQSQPQQSWTNQPRDSIGLRHEQLQNQAASKAQDTIETWDGTHGLGITLWARSVADQADRSINR